MNLKLATLCCVLLWSCSDGQDLPVECRSSADCAVGNCLETICTSDGVGGPSLLPGTPPADVVEVLDVDEPDADAADAETDADDTDVNVEADTEADVQEDAAVISCDDLVLSANALTVTSAGAALRVRNNSTAAAVVSVISASPPSIFRLVSPSNTRLPLSLNPDSSFTIELEAVQAESGTGVLDITTSACLISIRLTT
ncbi:MAG: hypothetical protein ACI82G_002739 [Bradymonadia bacterium]|jgi:hypothetical protein